MEHFNDGMEDNKMCLLCKDKCADKTGSHIMPSFLMKRINGEGKRDHEVGFVIKPYIVESYFGRDIYQEERSRVTDQEEKIDSRYNYDIRDNIFCSECEKKFSYFENEYAQSVTLKWNNSTIVENNRVSASKAMLFWISLVWRASVTEHLGKKLPNEIEEQLRYALTNNDCSKIEVKYLLFRCFNYSKTAGKGTFVGMDVESNAVCLIIDEYLLVMVFEPDENRNKYSFFGIDFSIDYNSINDGKRAEQIVPIPFDVFDQIYSSVIKAIVNDMKLPVMIRKLHRCLFDDDLQDSILAEVLGRIQTSRKIGDRYTIENYALCYSKVLVEKGLLVEHSDGTFSKA